MIDKENSALQGRNNVRLNSCDPTNSEYTAAWANTDKLYEIEQVSKPSPENVVDAKDWVDNGSKL
jgi:hypothetical protein